MQFFFILFLTTTFIVMTAVCDDSKHLQESTYRNQLHKAIAKFPRLHSETIWSGSRQQNHNNGKSTVKAKMISKKILTLNRTPSYKEVPLRMDNIFQKYFNDFNITNAILIKPRVLRCPYGFIRNNKNECFGWYSVYV
uniref:Uncharacterized protein n=1 Tax=Sipha flava TaxID=143950 RepID=A0A2S2PV86_9HEMI